MMVRNPLVDAFADAVGKRYVPADPESFWACEPLFRHLLDPQFPEALINTALRTFSEDHAQSGGHRRHLLLLAQTPAWTLSLRLLAKPRRYIHSATGHSLLAPVSGVPLLVDRYDLPADFRDAVFDPAQKLSFAGPAVVAPGELLPVRAGGPIFDYRIEQPLLVLMLETAPLGVLEWRFSKDSLYAWQYTDADPQVSDLKAAAWLAGRLAHQTSLKPLKALTTHANPGVRLAALHNIGRLSRSEAHRLLVRALDDPHPQVRRSAKQSLDREG